MCGIVGVVGQEAAAPRLLEALRRLEYRGYDSAGIATLIEGRIDRRRAEGKLGNLGMFHLIINGSQSSAGKHSIE